MRRRNYGLVLAGILMWVMMTGCSTANVDEVENGGQSDETAKKEVNEETVPPKVYIYQNSGHMAHFPEGSESTELEKVKKYILDEVGIEPIAIIPPAGAEAERLNLMLSSRDNLDVFTGNYLDYYQEDVIIPLNDLLKEHGKAILETFTPEHWDNVTDNEGNIWAIPRGEPLRAVYPVYVRTDWLEALDLEMPKTIDELENVLKVFQEKDPNQSGKKDTVLMTDLGGLKQSFLGGFTEYGNSNWLSNDGKILPVELHPGFKVFVEKMAEWYQKGYIHKEAFTKFDPLELLRTNRVGASAIWYSRITVNEGRLKSNFPNMKYEIARDISGPEGLLQTLLPGATPLGYMITSTAKYPEEIIKFLNWQYENLDNNITSYYGIQGEHWEWVDREGQIIKLVNENRPYVGEFYVSASLATEGQYSVDNPELIKHADYLRNEILDFSIGKRPFDYDIIYDQKSISTQVPNYEDINRLRTEEVTKFITGSRSIDQFDDFIQELYRAGLDKWIEEYTNQYNNQKSK